MPAKVRNVLTDLCDQALFESIVLFPSCEYLVGVGRFAEERINKVCTKYSLPHKIQYLLHPSPQNPHANKNWNSVARSTFEKIGIVNPCASFVDDIDDRVDNSQVKRKLFSGDPLSDSTP